MSAAVLFPLFLVFFLVAFLSSTVTRSRLMEPGMETQFSRYHRRRGCEIGVVDCAKDFVYSRFSVHEKISGLGVSFMLPCYFRDLPYFLCMFHSRQSWDIGETLSVKDPILSSG